MLTLNEVMTELKAKGTDQTRNTFRRHGAPEAMFGVKVGDLKPIAKRIRGNQQLAYQLYETGNSDAMYLAGLVADGSQMTTRQLDAWAKQASWYMLAEYTVPGVTVENSRARAMAMKWMTAKRELTATCGWATYSGLVAILPDAELDLAEIQQLLQAVLTDIDTAPNRVRYTMNGFVISVGTYVKPLLQDAQRVAKSLGAVQVDFGETSCKVPVAAEYIAKIVDTGRCGKKRKTLKC